MHRRDFFAAAASLFAVGFVPAGVEGIVERLESGGWLSIVPRSEWLQPKDGRVYLKSVYSQELGRLVQEAKCISSGHNIPLSPSIVHRMSAILATAE